METLLSSIPDSLNFLRTDVIVGPVIKVVFAVACTAEH